MLFVLADLIDWTGLASSILQPLRDFFDWGFIHLQIMFNNLATVNIEFVMGCIPSSWGSNLMAIISYISVANAWLPIDLAITLAGIYYAFLVVFILTRYIMLIF